VANGLDEARGRQLPAQTSFCAARLRPTVCSACFASRSYAVAMNCSRRRASAWVIFAAVLRASSASRRQCPASYSGGTQSPGLPHGSNAKASVRFRRVLHEWLRRFSRGLRAHHRRRLISVSLDFMTDSPALLLDEVVTSNRYRGQLPRAYCADASRLPLSVLFLLGLKSSVFFSSSLFAPIISINRRLQSLGPSGDDPFSARQTFRRYQGSPQRRLNPSTVFSSLLRMRSLIEPIFALSEA
jgi:hypothetical protein